MRVVDDFAGQEHLPVWKLPARLIRVVDGAVDAVAEAELASEVHDEPSRGVLIVRFLDGGDQPAAVAAGEDVRDFVLEVEALPEDQGRHAGLLFG